ncbi:KGGVGR-motif variant AAA ATPase [Providencia stuartii]|uniref:KGGVGR-motif variant AAA ATPase n=4 Tax=Providencia stuartii TaxID=588 RepID=UPI0028C01846|nr:AAA family ATPase [Providencia stuartii]MDT7047886.1 AAA family ATPase [Providencia stuartii]
MLKSFQYIELLENILNSLVKQLVVEKFHIKLSVNQQLNVYIVSNTITSFSEFKDIVIKSTELKIDLELDSVMFEFFSTEEADDIPYIFERESVDYGLRRSLDNLIDGNLESIESNVITFYSHKGGVGRTTSLALLARYYSEQGKSVFTIDCDFEAPGLLNFFSISQFNTPKNGVVEYLNDKKFNSNVKLNDEYIYQVSNRYSGEGKIYLMPAGNVFSSGKNQYLEGLSRLDIFGPTVFLNGMKNLINEIQEDYKPDVILIDSRTGFNNVFGSLSHLSDHVVALFGDDNQNKPGLEFILDKYSESLPHSNLTLVLSIVSNNIRKRLSNFSSYITNYIVDRGNEDFIIPSFVFPREAALEMIGTPDESEDDFKYFSSKLSPTSYTPFFNHMDDVLNNMSVIDDNHPNEEDYEVDYSDEENEDIVDDIIRAPENETSVVNVKDHMFSNESKLHNKIVSDLLSDFPELYAENISFEDNYLREKFYIRTCMQDIFLPEYKLLIGGKGTGKTFFYRALQNERFKEALLSRAEKKTNSYIVSNIVSRAKDKQGFIDLITQFDKEMNNESFVRKFWLVYMWSEISRQNIFEIKTKCDFIIMNTGITAKKIKDLINNEDKYLEVEEDMALIDNFLKRRDQKLILTFDQLDEVVKPMYWDKGISPLIRMCQSNSWSNIQPKLFLRRDLFEKLGNITNKQSLSSQIIDLEWSSEEMYAFFFKIIYSKSSSEFTTFLNENLSKSFVENQVNKKLRKKNSFNQLPDDEFILRPIVNIFFGKPNLNYVDAYEALYRNIRNANQTISLRPFLDMIKLAIEEQIKDNGQKRKGAIIGIDYCFLRSVRAKAVERYFHDMAREEGNDVIKYFIEDIQNNYVSNSLKCSSLIQKDFEKLVQEVRNNHQEISDVPTTTFEDMLVLNGIIFVTLIPGGIKKFSFAYLYKFYLNLKSPRQRRRNI